MSKRDQIRMTQAEIDTFLAGRRTMNIATNGKDGFPHMVAMWYGFLEDAPALWTYAKSQKVRNLQRNNQISCLVEAGDTYHTLQGVMLMGRGVIIDDREALLKVGKSLYERYTGPLTEADRANIEKDARKRIAIRIDVEKIISWDHRKLG
ncbi:MAG: pyridoxamine 5'-phosphate oxidase family protein [Chloroflexota bacterium]